ncbi:response regulator [Aurantiacibacter spongiae]|uniref:Response regulator n=1 Tax=Aurantiacibacter spongiae TaxID=2488860 RepID=A0A3N5DT04_9SPHN|nr:response regulator [Aurantiacibacter spongiae]RPF72441.1 response regulator [Aurantiacibacter spongiae]
MTENCTILLLEDEPLILMDLEFAAEEKGCEPLCATGVTGAMKHIETGRIHVAVLDVTLQNGETCVPVAKELDRLEIPYLLHSGDLNRVNETVRTLGVRHIPKPCDSGKVIAAALEFIDKRDAA